MGDTKFLDPNNLSRFPVAAIVESSREVSQGRHASHMCNEARDAHEFLTKSGRVPQACGSCVIVGRGLHGNCGSWVAFTG